MNRRASRLFALILLTASLAFAHGNKAHIKGTVEKINPDSIVIKAMDGKTMEVKLVQSTIFVKAGQPAKLQDLAVGDRVAIHATPKGETLEAEEVRFGAAPNHALPSKKPQP